MQAQRAQKTQKSKKAAKQEKLVVKREPPTLEEAMFAAAGMSDDTDQQIEIAAMLMGMPLEQATVDALKSARPRANIVDISVRGRPARAIVVEHKRRTRTFVTPSGTLPGRIHNR